jgi:RecA/RadA recombinase
MTDAQLELRRRQQLSVLRTGNETVDQLLGGGIQPEATHVFYGAPRVTTRLLQRLAVLAQLPGPDGGLNAGRVVYVDGENNFDPYALSQLAIERHLDPRKALQRISLARAFSWEQVVELVAEKLAGPGGADGAGLVCIAGITTMLVPTEPRHYQQLLQVLGGIKQLLARQHGQVTVVASTRLHPQSAYRPLGGNVLCHFATVLVRVEDHPKLVEYILERHPSHPPQRLLDFKPSQPRGPVKVRPLDHFFRLPTGETPQL